MPSGKRKPTQAIQTLEDPLVSPKEPQTRSQTGRFTAPLTQEATLHKVTTASSSQGLCPEARQEPRLRGRGGRRPWHCIEKKAARQVPRAVALSWSTKAAGEGCCVLGAGERAARGEVWGPEEDGVRAGGASTRLCGGDPDAGGPAAAGPAPSPQAHAPSCWEEEGEKWLRGPGQLQQSAPCQAKKMLFNVHIHY